MKRLGVLISIKLAAGAGFLRRDGLDGVFVVAVLIRQCRGKGCKICMQIEQHRIVKR